MDADAPHTEADVEARVAARTAPLFPSAALRTAVLRDLGRRSGAPAREARRAPRLARWAAALVPAGAALAIAVVLVVRERDRASRLDAPAPARDLGAIQAARARNRAVYDRERAHLHRVHAGQWVAIAVPAGLTAGGAYETWTAGATLEAVRDFRPESKHRYVFRVGDEGDLDVFVSAWYGTRFAGSGGLARGLGVDLVLHASVDVAKDGRQARFAGGTPFPAVAFHFEAPDGRASPRNGDATPEVFVGSLGPDLMLTPQDDAELGLERFEVPGTATVGGVPCRRVLVTASIPRVGARGTLVACVPDVPAEGLAAMSRSRHAFWQWGEGLQATLRLDRGFLLLPADESPTRSWLVFGNNRVLARGASPGEALDAASGFRDVLYHRYVTAWPMMDASRAPDGPTAVEVDGGERVQVDLAEVRLSGTRPTRIFYGELSFRPQEPTPDGLTVVVLDPMDEAAWVRASLALSEAPFALRLLGAPADATIRAAYVRGRIVQGGKAAPPSWLYVVARTGP